MKIELKQLLDAIDRFNTTLDNPGFCRACGAEVEGIEPDAQGEECEECGAFEVYGAEECLFLDEA